MTAHAPLVSILIPCHNAEGYLRECLASALAQTYARTEIVVVDDGSSDGSLGIAQTFESKRVRVLTQENRGQPAALNAALAVAQGEYIQYLDADDLLHPRKIECQMARLATAGQGAIASGAWARFEDSPSNAVLNPEPVWRDLAPVDFLVESWAGGGMMPVMAWLVPRRVAELAGPWNDAARWASLGGVDGEYFVRVVLQSSACLFCADAISYYRVVPGSHASIRSRQSLEASLDVLIACGQRLLCVEDSARVRSAAADMLQRFVYAAYPDAPDLVRVAEARVCELGGSTVPLAAGRMTLAAARLVGWKSAKRLRRMADRVART